MTVIPETQTAFPVLYILMRNDLASMNAGKGMAQASHASNAFWNHTHAMDFETDSVTFDLIGKWQHETPQGFGTVLVLGVNEVQMRTAVDVAHKLDYVSGVVHDPTYPILVPTELGKHLNVDETALLIGVGENHNYVTISLDTCAYIFGDKNDPLLGAVVGNFPLHP